jgi:glycerol-3-phosphate acyltransferase PlsY
MFANLWVKGGGVVAKVVGSLVVLSLVWTLVVAIIRLVRSDNGFWIKYAVSATLVAYALLFSANAAIGRICLGLGSAQSSRYMNYVTLGVFGLYLHLLSLESLR